MGKHTFKSIINYFFFAANLFAALLLVVAAFSDRVPPHSSLLFSYLGLGFPFICALNLFFVFYWIFAANWKFLFVSIVAFGVSTNAVKTYLSFHLSTNVIPKENTIKILSYNVMGFAYQNHTAKSPNKIIEYIANSNADLVCLQEVIVKKSSKSLTLDKLNDALNMYPYHSFINISSNDWQESGLSLYSKFPITRSKKLTYKSNNNGSSIHEINIKGKKVALINNHLESFKLTMKDKSSYSDFIKGDTEALSGIKGTIQNKLGPAFLKRAEQARIVAEEAKKVQADYVLVCGDFNDTPVSYTIHTLQKNLTDSFVESGFGFGTTYNKNFFWFRIDHILHSANMKSFNCTVDRVDYSDHYPLWCYLQLN